MAGIDSYVKLMLHCDGADASTTFTDSATTPKTVTANGNAQIDTAQSVFGGASGLFDGNGDYLSVPDSDDFALGSGDWTIDFRVRFNGSLSGEQYFVYTATDASNSFGIRMDDATTFRFFSRSGGSLIAEYTYSWSPAANTWYHVAIVRSGSTMYLFIDGTSVTFTASVAISTNTIPNMADTFKICGFAASTYFNGWIDEFRVSVGIARWTANFTPPTEAYSAATAWTQNLSDTVTLSDAIKNSPGKILADTMTLTDTISNKVIGKILADTITLSDAVVKGAGKILGDTITLADSIITKAIGKVLADTITLSDAISHYWQAFRTFSDTITLSDSIAKAVTKPLADTIILSDNISKTVGKILADTITLSDAITKSFGKVLADTITLSDSIVKSMGKVFSDTISLTDNLIKVFNRISAGIPELMSDAFRAVRTGKPFGGIHTKDEPTGFIKTKDKPTGV